MATLGGWVSVMSEVPLHFRFKFTPLGTVANARCSPIATPSPTHSALTQHTQVHHSKTITVTSALSYRGTSLIRRRTTLHPTPCTLHLHPTPCTMHPIRYTQHPAFAPGLPPGRPRQAAHSQKEKHVHQPHRKPCPPHALAPIDSARQQPPLPPSDHHPRAQHLFSLHGAPPRGAPVLWRGPHYPPPPPPPQSPPAYRRDPLGPNCLQFPARRVCPPSSRAPELSPSEREREHCTDSQRGGHADQRHHRQVPSPTLHAPCCTGLSLASVRKENSRAWKGPCCTS